MVDVIIEVVVGEPATVMGPTDCRNAAGEGIGGDEGRLPGFDGVQVQGTALVGEGDHL